MSMSPMIGQMLIILASDWLLDPKCGNNKIEMLCFKTDKDQAPANMLSVSPLRL